MQKIGSFVVVPLKYKDYTRYLYIREQVTSKGDSKYTEGNALYVANCPPNCTREYLEGIFGPCISCGFINEVRMHDHAIMVFESPAIVRNILRKGPLRTDFSTTTEGLEQVNGLSLWLGEANARIARAMHPELMKAEANKAVREFVDQKKKELDVNDKLATTTDEDGWTLVTYRRGQSTKKATDGKKTNVKVASQGAAYAAASARVKRDAAYRKSILADFYKFKKNENRNDELSSLKRRFEMDKKKVEKMKANRKFKPY